MKQHNDHSVILEVRDLTVAYGNVEALHKVSLTIRRGEIVTVIGPNGAGKTTLLSALMGLLPAGGEIVYMGHAKSREREVEYLVRHGMTLVPEKRELFAEMSVEDNLLLGAFDRYRTGHRDQMETMDEVFELFPRLVMLDEPSLGLAPLIIKEIFRIISELKQTGVAILLVEQNARAALQIADYGYVLETGEVSLAGPSKELAADQRVIDAYLGLGHKR